MTRESCGTPPRRRYLSLWLPFLSAENRARRTGCDRPAEPLVFVERQRGAMRIAALDAQARAIGLERGMSLADARARAPGLLAVPSRPQDDEALLLRLAAWCERFTPLVALEPADGLTLDVTGCGHLFGDDEGLRATLLADLARFGLTGLARFGVTPEAARALTRFGQDEEADETQAIRALPSVALEMGEEARIALSRAGLRTIGDLLDRPSRALASRLGMAVTARLDRLAGREDRRITPLRPLPDCVVGRRFAEPFLDIAGMERELAPLVEEANGILRERGQGGRAFEFLFYRTDGRVFAIEVESAAPIRDAPRLMRLFRLKQERLADPLDPGFGFDAIGLSVRRAEAFVEATPDFDGRERESEGVAALADRLVARLGPGRVRVFRRGNSHDPERASGAAPFGEGGGEWAEPGEGPAPERPLRLFDPPEPIEAIALTPDEPPQRFRWRRAWRDVVKSEGPERIAPEWWVEAKKGAKTRDYYRLEDKEGRRFWAFREGLYGRETARPRWFLHGLFA